MRNPRRAHLYVLLLLVALAAAGALGWVELFGDLPPPDELITRTSPDTTKIYDRNGRLLYEILDPRAGRRTRVSLAELPPYLVSAVLAVEDANYYSHPGVDATGILRAFAQFVRNGQIVSGGSTITQQLARALLLTKEEASERTLSRKLREMLLAWRLSQAYSKDQILEMYLNETYFGNLAYGIEAAARTFFGKPARDLDLAEAALLAGLIQSPAAYDPYVSPSGARARQRVVLDLMVKQGFIARERADSAHAEILHFAAPEAREQIRAPHFVAYVRNLLERRYGAEAVNRGGMRVITTLDLDLQEQAEAIVSRHVGVLKERTRNESEPEYNLNDAAVVALHPATGEILAMVGSADYFDESIDGAVNVALALRQPGSAIKPLTYAAAFARDYTPATVLSDVPTIFQTREGEPYAPQNYDRRWHGPMSLRRALATSSNVIAVKVLHHIGIQALLDTARALGITTLNESDRFGLALTLGGGEVKLLELTAAYAAFANAGVRVTPLAIREVALDGKALDDWTPATETMQAVSPQVAYLITSILSDDAARIPAFGEDSVLNLPRPAAAKTGTTSEFRDNWTIGYTPDLAVGVWAGNADNSPMYRVTGISGAGPIWHDVMEAAHRGLPIRDWQRPEAIVEKEICDASGLLPTRDCERRRYEVFIKGTEPTRLDDSYRRVALDAPSGLLWAGDCPGPRIERVFRVYPPEATDWAIKRGAPQIPELDCRGRAVASGTTSVALGNKASENSGFLLVMVSPAPNAVYETSPQVPSEMQKVEVAARLTASDQGVSGAPSLREVTLYVDGAPIGTLGRAPYRVLWQLTPGDHQAQAVGITREGRRLESETVHFSVQRGE